MVIVADIPSQDNEKTVAESRIQIQAPASNRLTNDEPLPKVDVMEKTSPAKNLMPKLTDKPNLTVGTKENKTTVPVLPAAPPSSLKEETVTKNQTIDPSKAKSVPTTTLSSNQSAVVAGGNIVIPASPEVSKSTVTEATILADTQQNAADKGSDSMKNKDPPDSIEESVPPLSDLDSENGDAIEAGDDDDAGDIGEPVVPGGNGKADSPQVSINDNTRRPQHTISYGEPDDGDTHFFVYYLTVIGVCILMYVLFHNKQKILALIVEGRQERRRRPNTSQYRPLDNNLEDVIQVGVPKNGRSTNIIY